jgi:hypothetical protein
MKKIELKGGNKMKKKYTLGIFAIFTIALLGIGAVSAFGFGNGMMSGLNDEDREVQEQQMKAVQEAIDNEDYDSWEALMQERIQQMTREVNQERFSELVEKHKNRAEFHAAMDELRESGEFSFEAMEQLREQYGIEEGFGQGMKGKRMHGAEGMRGKGIGQGFEGNCHFTDSE